MQFLSFSTLQQSFAVVNEINLSARTNNCFLLIHRKCLFYFIPTEKTTSIFDSGKTGTILSFNCYQLWCRMNGNGDFLINQKSCMKIQLKVQNLYHLSYIPKQSSWPDLSLCWDHSGPQALCLTLLGYAISASVESMGGCYSENENAVCS